MDAKALAVLTESVSAMIKADDPDDEIEYAILISSGHNTCIKRFCPPDRLLQYMDLLAKQRHMPPPPPKLELAN